MILLAMLEHMAKPLKPVLIMLKHMAKPLKPVLKYG